MFKTQNIKLFDHGNNSLSYYTFECHLFKLDQTQGRCIKHPFDNLPQCLLHNDNVKTIQCSNSSVVIQKIMTIYFIMEKFILKYHIYYLGLLKTYQMENFQVLNILIV